MNLGFLYCFCILSVVVMNVNLKLTKEWWGKSASEVDTWNGTPNVLCFTKNDTCLYKGVIVLHRMSTCPHINPSWMARCLLTWCVVIILTKARVCWINIIILKPILFLRCRHSQVFSCKLLRRNRPKIPYLTIYVFLISRIWLDTVTMEASDRFWPQSSNGK